MPPGASPAATRDPTRAASIYCDICGEELKSFEISQAVRDVSALDICTCCLEAILDATAINPRSEVGLVGSCGGRS